MNKKELEIFTCYANETVKTEKASMNSARCWPRSLLRPPSMPSLTAISTKVGARSHHPATAEFDWTVRLRSIVCGEFVLCMHVTAA